MAEGVFTRERGIEILFQEVNEHLRSTEAKSIELTVGYFGVVAIALSIVGAHGLGKTSLGNLAAYGALTAMGLLSFHVQTAFRGWKVHYLACLREYIDEYPVEKNLLPDFLFVQKGGHRPRRPSADRGLTLLTAIVTTGTLALFVRQWAAYWPSNWAHVVAGIATAAAVILLAGDAVWFALKRRFPKLGTWESRAKCKWAAAWHRRRNGEDAEIVTSTAALILRARAGYREVLNEISVSRKEGTVDGDLISFVRDTAKVLAFALLRTLRLAATRQDAPAVSAKTALDRVRPLIDSLILLSETTTADDLVSLPYASEVEIDATFADKTLTAWLARHGREPTT